MQDVPYAIEMVNITKRFPGIIANDNVTLQLKKGEIHALLGENGAGKSTLMSVLFGLYQAEEGVIKKDGVEVKINNPNDANALGIGMVHQHFKLVECFSVLDNIILGDEDTKHGILQRARAREKVMALSEKYGLRVDPDALIEDISVGMQQRTEILKMLYRDNEILIFDEPTAVLTPQEIQELLQIMRNLAAEGKSILFISHKLNEIMAVADRCSVLRKGKYMGTVNIADTTKAELSRMMVGRDVEFAVTKGEAHPAEVVLDVKNLTVPSKVHKNNAVKNVSFQVHAGEIVCIAGIDGNGQSELVYAISGLEPASGGTITMCGVDITHAPIRRRSILGMSHIPEDRHKHGLVLDYTLEDNMILQRYFEPEFTDKFGFLRRKNIRAYAERLIEQYDVRSGQGPVTVARSMSGGNQQKAIIAREIDKNPQLLIAVQPTRGLDVGAIEYIHKQIVAQRDAGKAVLLVSLELDEVMTVSDRILVMYEGEIVGELDPKTDHRGRAGPVHGRREEGGEGAVKKERESLIRKDGFQTLLASLVCVLGGLIVGYVVLLIIEPSGAFEAIIAVMKSFLRFPGALKLKYFGQALVRTAPLLLCALSVLFAYKVGMFNIGAAGQYCAGACAALYAALAWNLPWYVCILLGMLAGALLGMLAGALRTLFNVNVVISGIMLNWITLYLTNLVLGTVKNPTSPYTKTLQSTNPGALIPSLGLEKLFNNEKSVTIAIPIAVLTAVLVWVVLNKTKFGYELKATGSNYNAAKYCGMKENQNIILTMVIAGALAGFGAGLLYLTGIEDWETTISSVPAMGFNGIAVAFLGGLSPIGSILSAFFIQYITTGGGNVDLQVYCSQISSLISALIIYLCAFVGFFKYFIQTRLRKADERKAAKAAQIQEGGEDK